MIDKTVTSTQTPEDEYIDMIDVLGFVWKARLAILLGMSIGLIGAWIISTKRKPPLYITTMAVNTEYLSSPSQEADITVFNNTVSLRVAANAIYDQLSKDPDSRIHAALESKGLTRETFIADQIANDGPIPLRLIKGDREGSFAVESRFRNSDEGAVLTAALVRASREVLTKLNAPSLKSNSNSVTTQAEKTLDATHPYQQVIKMRLAEEATPRTALFKLEARLVEKLGPLAMSIPRGGSPDQVMRLLGALLHTKKISDPDAQEVQAEREALVARLEMIEAKYDQATRDAEVSLKSLSADIILRATGTKDLIPIFTADAASLEQKLATSSIERYESKRGLFLALGVILGAMLGLMAYGMRLFLAENRDRMRAIFRG